METQTTSFLEPEQIVKSFNLEKGDHIADFGAGHGYFAIPMARIVGGNGKVYALDIQKSALDVVRTKAKLEHLLNIDPIWADLDHPVGSKIKHDFLDFVLMANILFQAENKPKYFEEAYKTLKKNGRLAVIEWDETPAPMGPPLNNRVRQDTVRRFAAIVGFEFYEEFKAGSHHYGLLFKKQ